MNPLSQNTSTSAASQDVESTLRLIASLPAPQGLEDRITAGLRAAPHTASLLHWPAASRPSSGWMRTAAAAAIVAVVAGGGWGIHSLVQPPPPAAKGIALPLRPAATGGFSSAGAMRTPQTLNGPVLVQSVAAPPAQAKPAKKTPARTAHKPLGSAQASTAGKAAASASQAAAPPAETPGK